MCLGFIQSGKLEALLSWWRVIKVERMITGINAEMMLFQKMFVSLK